MLIQNGSSAQVDYTVSNNTFWGSDGNNGANPRVRTQTEELWERFEHGPMGMFGEHDVPEPMVSRRARVIRDRFPALAPAVVSALAERTSGMDRSQIVRAVAEHLAGGDPPDMRYHRGQCPRELLAGVPRARVDDRRQRLRLG